MRVVITGIGLVSPIGNGITDFWNNLLEGKSGLRDITRFDASTFPCRIAGETDFDAREYLDELFVEVTSLSSQFACAAFKMAQTDAGFETFPTPTDVIIGSGVSNLAPIMEQYKLTPEAMSRYLPGDPVRLLKVFIGGAASGIALLSRATGLVTTVANACTSGLNAVGLAYDRIKSRRAEVVIAGSCDAPLNHLVHSAFCSSGHYTSNNDPSAQRPFDRRREKCAPGEGATVLILESERRARARGARIYCEITGFESGVENTNEMFFIDVSGAAWGRLIGRVSSGVSHVNTHGISDRLVDAVEARALRAGFGRRARKITIASIKGAVGSGLSAAGGFQIAAGAKTIETGMVPPTLNYCEQDPQIPVNVIRKPTRLNPKSILISSHGVTGYNSVLKLGRYRI